MLVDEIIETPWGQLGLVITSRGLQRVLFDVASGTPGTGEWATAFREYCQGISIPLSLPIDLNGVSDFAVKVLLYCRTIPFGTVICYRDIALKLALSPGAARAVGQVLAHNPVPIAIPCHRVVGVRGQLTGFIGGLYLKRCLLAHEGVPSVLPAQELQLPY